MSKKSRKNPQLSPASSTPANIGKGSVWISWLWLGAALVLLLGVCLWWAQPGLFNSPSAVPLRPSSVAPAKAVARTMVDEQACQGCHANEVKQWQGSHHHQAMQLPNEQTMLGDFNDVTFTSDKETTRFFRKDGGFWVNTPGPDGQLADFQVAYTFGVEPLQQYLLELPGGHLQPLGVAWDTEKKA